MLTDVYTEGNTLYQVITKHAACGNVTVALFLGLECALSYAKCEVADVVLTDREDCRFDIPTVLNPDYSQLPYVWVITHFEELDTFIYLSLATINAYPCADAIIHRNTTDFYN